MKTYFIQQGKDGPIKIGKSTDAYKRLSTLQTGCPEELHLVALMDGDCELEMHDKFSRARLRGEWFKPTNALLAHIKEHGVQKSIQRFFVFRHLGKQDYGIDVESRKSRLRSLSGTFHRFLADSTDFLLTPEEHQRLMLERWVCAHRLAISELDLSNNHKLNQLAREHRLFEEDFSNV